MSTKIYNILACGIETTKCITAKFQKCLQKLILSNMPHHSKALTKGLSDISKHGVLKHEYKYMLAYWDPSTSMLSKTDHFTVNALKIYFIYVYSN